MTHLQTDDYTLAILPLAGLLGNGTAGERCPGIEAYGPAYHGVMDAGMFGYRLYTYHAMVRAGYGQDVERKVRERHTDMFAPVVELAPLLVMIRSAVGVGEVVTPTPCGEVVTPVEMNVALALLLGYPGSPHYVTGPGRRTAETQGMAPGIDWCLAACLARGRQEMIGTFDSLSRLVEMQGKAFIRQRRYWC